MDRAVVVRMRRRAPDERVRDYRERTTRPEGDALRELLAKWAADVADWVGDPWPQMLPGVADRPADVWEPLLVVADLAGGDWPGRAREACGAFITGARDDTASWARDCSPTCGRCSGRRRAVHPDDPAELRWRAAAAGRTGTTVNGASPRRDSGGYRA